jgi:hypothetical protein
VILEPHESLSIFTTRDLHQTTHGCNSIAEDASQELNLALPGSRDSAMSTTSVFQREAAGRDVCQSNIFSESSGKHSLSSRNGATAGSAEQSDQLHCATQTSVHLQACL